MIVTANLEGDWLNLVKKKIRERGFPGLKAIVSCSQKVVLLCLDTVVYMSRTGSFWCFSSQFPVNGDDRKMAKMNCSHL